MKIDFAKYLSPVFVETGSYVGDGIAEALKADFRDIYSIELSPKYYDICKDRFKSYSNINLVLGDSSVVLYDTIKNIQEKITFWLDGHYSSGDTACGQYAVPLIQELEQIKRHPIKHHTILIDDVRLIRSKRNEFNTFPISLPEVEDLVKSINHQYNISYEYGVEDNDILIATIS